MADERPALGGASQAGEPATTIPPSTDIDWYLYAFDSGVAVGEIRGEVRGWIAGEAAGVACGRAETLAEIEAARSAEIDAINRALAGWLATTPAYEELARRRGDVGRAETQARILRERGVVIS